MKTAKDAIEAIAQINMYVLCFRGDSHKSESFSLILFHLDLKLECKHDGSKITAMAIGALGRRGAKAPLSHCRRLSSLRVTRQGRSKELARLLQSNQYQSRDDNQTTHSKKRPVP